MTVRASIEDAEIEAALQTVLQSSAFARSERARELLSYLVGEERQGRGDRLKAFSIAQDVFGRDDSFDPQTDALVRVQASRLRDLLETHYGGDGLSDPVIIQVPVGSYAPRYERQTARQPSAGIPPKEHSPDTDTPAGSPNVSSDVPVSAFIVRNIRRFWLVLVAMLLLLVLILALTWQQFRTVTAGVEAVVRSVTEAFAPAQSALSLPSLSLVTSSEGGADDAQAVAELRRDISRFSLIRLAAGSELPAETDYRMTVQPGTGGSLLAEVANTASGDTVWAGSIPERRSADAAVPASAGVLTALLPADGLIYADAEQSETASDLAICLRRTQLYYRHGHKDAFETALACHDDLIEANGAQPLAQADQASLIVEGLGRSYSTGERGLDSALMLGREAVDALPASAYVQRAYAVALLADGQTSMAVAQMEAAYQLNPANLNIGASYGFVLLQSGQYAQARDILTTTVDAASNALPWWNRMLFLSAAALNDEEAMLDAAQGLTEPAHPETVLVRLIAAHLSGDADQRDGLLERLSDEPGLRLDDPYAYFAATLPAEQAQWLTEIARDAGY